MRTYSSVESEFRHYFGESGGFSWCDFRPQLEGNLINDSLTILPLASAEATRAKAWNEFHRVWAWLQSWADYFDDEDVIQVVIGFSRNNPPSRQIFKGTLKVEYLPILPKGFDGETLLKCGGQFRELINWDVYTEYQTK